jgi:hypothetical protein
VRASEVIEPVIFLRDLDLMVVRPIARIHATTRRRSKAVRARSKGRVGVDEIAKARLHRDNGSAFPPRLVREPVLDGQGEQCFRALSTLLAAGNPPSSAYRR